MAEEAECQPNFINEFQRKHYEACMRARELSRRQPLSAAQLKEQALRVREITNAESPEEKKEKTECTLPSAYPISDFHRWMKYSKHCKAGQTYSAMFGAMVDSSGLSCTSMIRIEKV